MLKRIGLFTVVGLLAMVVLAACGGKDETVKPTVTRIPATNAPVVAPTEGGTTAAASPAASGSPAASPAASSAGSPEASVAASPAASGVSSPVATQAASQAASPVASPAVSGDAGAATTTALTVELHDIFFDPKEITIPANTDLTITLVNKGAAPHTFDVDALNVHSGEVAPGATATVTINAPAGDYEFYCAIPGHKQAGMVGTLHVVEGGTSTASPVASPAVAVSGVQAVAPTVEMVDIAFSPKEITIPANTDVVVNLVNKGVTVHSFDIDALNVHSGQYTGGQTGTVTINAAPGEYEYYCAIPGHKPAGMVGKLIVQ
ncbi:MAG: hypothetical protein QOF33_3171 [Thermomicrobiales bacterium]|nr:hypothetical protein [Thermomicrobiales bacterium]